MMRFRSILPIAMFVFLACTGAKLYAEASTAPSAIAETTASLRTPTLASPTWIAAPAQQPAGSPASPPTPSKRTVTYVIKTDGNITTSVEEFRQKANQTLNSPNGWPRMGIQFQEVATGGQFSLILAQAENITNYSPQGCSATLSCAVGNNILINQTRWLTGTSIWSQAGGSLEAYRSMVINHEVGHWLGHGHAACPAAGQPAPIMRQQSVDLGGCTPNSWPLTNELHSSRLGI